MQILFSQSEIQNALLELLEKQITLAPGQYVCIEFDTDHPDNIIAHVDVFREGQKPSMRRGLTVKQETVEPVTDTSLVNETEEQTKVRKTRGPNKPKVIISETPTLTGAPTPPFEQASEDTIKEETDDLGDEGDQLTLPCIPETLKEAAASATIDTAPKAPLAIFQNPTSSAPKGDAPKVTSTPPNGPFTVVSTPAKSLFANLVKPQHDAPKSL
jgi:hypothetical protein